MGLTLTSSDRAACCLCGSQEGLSGEHKIKASALRQEFGREAMVIATFGDPDARIRPVQGPKSKALHFAARICAACNGARTQPADREFDELHSAARALVGEGQDPSLAMSQERYEAGGEAYLNVFRYFAKLLCCHLADVAAPIPRRLADFAAGRTSHNCIWLSIDHDWRYQRIAQDLPAAQYASHGGLVVYGDKKSGAPGGFHSTLTVGAVRYVYYLRLTWMEKLELAIGHKEFARWCRDKVERFRDSPISREEQLALGLTADVVDE